MMNVKEVVFNDEGQIVALKGTATKKIRCIKPIPRDSDPISWTALGLDYCGG